LIQSQERKVVAKKKRRAATSMAQKEERGYRVVDKQDRPVYLPVEGGVSEAEAERLSANLLIPTKVIRIEGSDEQT
jgi:hypothetical protein